MADLFFGGGMRRFRLSAAVFQFGFFVFFWIQPPAHNALFDPQVPAFHQFERFAALHRHEADHTGREADG